MRTAADNQTPQDRRPVHADLKSRIQQAVAISWKRTRSMGLSPAVSMDRPQFGEINLEGRLFRAASPVLKIMQSQITGERLSVMLIDSRASMLTTVNGCTAIDAVAQRLGATPGAVWREDTTGTNALATPFETRRSIFIHGREHYVEALKNFSCYGAPIFNPATGRLEGVLDIMSDADAANTLMRPFIDSAVEDIQQNLALSNGHQTLAVMKAFESATKHHSAVVIGLSNSVLLQSAAAAALLSPADVTMIRDMSFGEISSEQAEFTLANGQEATAAFEQIEGANGVLVRLQTRQRSFVPRSAAPVDRRHRLQSWTQGFHDGALSAVVIGEAGTGRSAALSEATPTSGVVVVSAKTEAAEDILAVLRQVLADDAAEVLVVDDVDLLNAECLAAVEKIVSAGGRRVLASSSPPQSEQSTHGRILGMFALRLDMPALRELRSELFSIIADVAGPGVKYRFTGKAARVLESYSWPGNRTELAAVLTALSGKRGTLIDLHDLPAHLRTKSTTKTMTPWQRASCDAILNALEMMHGNKAHAADFLGISRNTLYHHIREYGIHA